MNLSRRFTGAIATLLTCAGLSVVVDAAAVEPPVNTGGTSFMDGFGDPRGSGFSYMQYARFSSASSIKDSEGKDIPVFRNPHLSVFADLNQFLYTFKTDSWAVHPGVYALIPL